MARSIPSEARHGMVISLDFSGGKWYFEIQTFA